MNNIYYCNLIVSYLETEKARKPTLLVLKGVVYKPTGIYTLTDTRILRKFKHFGTVTVESVEVISELGKSLI